MSPLVFQDMNASGGGARNLVLYGPPGCGKTTHALTLPGRKLVLNAEGPNALKFAHTIHGDTFDVVPFEGRQTLIDVGNELKADAGKTWQGFVLDSGGEVHRSLVDEYAGRGRPQVQHYGDAGNDIERFLRMMRDLPIPCVVVAHEEMVETADGTILMPLIGTKKMPQKACAMADDVGYLAPVSTEDGGVRWLAQLRAGNGRYAKNRGGALGTVAEVNLAEWLERISAAEAAGKAKPKTNKVGA